MTFRDWRRAAAILAVPVLLALSAGPAGATSASKTTAPAARTATAADVQAAPSACSDPAYTLEGGKWKGTVNWRFQTSSSPSEYSTSAVLAVVKRSFNNMTGAHNDCGLPDNVTATNTYAGSTSAAPGVTKRGYCSSRDSKNVVGFGPLPSGVLAVTCTWTIGSRIVESDIRVNSNEAWALTVSSCHFWQELLEPTLTHEFGHVLGLGHVGEQKHGRLTMSTMSDGPCDNAESTLGLGDIEGLHHLYP